MTTEAVDLKMVREVLSEYGLSTKRFSKKDRQGRKTPDFRVMVGDELLAYCEVKSPGDEWLDIKIDQAKPWQIVGGARSDPTFNRLGAHIHKAVSQFDAVNIDRRLPNILVFVNHDDMSSSNDLWETLTGHFRTADGRQIASVWNVSEGRIREEKFRIDLYIWLDYASGKVTEFLFSESDENHMHSLLDYFGKKNSDIHRPSFKQYGT